MEELWKILGVTKGVTAVIGSGGKTSLLYELAEELRPCGTVLLATTTHIMRPPQYPFAQTPEELAAALAAGGVACVGSLTLGATAFGQPIRQAAHRPAIYARLAGAPWSAVITPEMAARVICAEGLCDIVYVNQVDDPEVSPSWAEAFVRASSVPVVAGSLQARRWRRIS